MIYDEVGTGEITVINVIGNGQWTNGTLILRIRK